MIAFIAPIRAGIQTDKYLFDGGYARLNSSTGNFLFFYYNKDHLGNNHEVLNHKGGVRQVTSYYPFGAPYADDAAISGTDIQPYKYNGKELDLMHGLNTYDYSARQYYSILGRWDRVDPLCERYYSTSPYAYCSNNPIRFVDPTGEAPGDFFQNIDDAAKDFGLYYNDNSIRSNKEFASYIFEIKDDKGNKGYSYSMAVIGTIKSSTPVSEIGAKNVATIHTHAAFNPKLINGNNVFSGSFDNDRVENLSSNEKKEITERGTDIGNANFRHLDSYLVTPNGSLQKYSPKTGKISVLSNEMPSDFNDPDRLNYIDTRERHPESTMDLLRYQENINKGILNSIIK